MLCCEALFTSPSPSLFANVCMSLSLFLCLQVWLLVYRCFGMTVCFSGCVILTLCVCLCVCLSFCFYPYVFECLSLSISMFLSFSHLWKSVFLCFSIVCIADCGWVCLSLGVRVSESECICTYAGCISMCK